MLAKVTVIDPSDARWPGPADPGAYVLAGHELGDGEIDEQTRVVGRAMQADRSAGPHREFGADHDVLGGAVGGVTVTGRQAALTVVRTAESEVEAPAEHHGVRGALRVDGRKTVSSR